MDYAAAVVELFKAPHAEFVAERKRLAGIVRAAGNKLGAARLVAIQRPPISAWVVNQLYWHARDAFDEMFATASRLRAGDLSASQAHRESIARLRQRAATLLAEGGHGAAEVTLRRVGVTLSALAATGTFDPEQPGCLADDRDPPGFEAIAAMTMTPQPAAPVVVAPPKVVDEVDHDAALRSLDDGDDDDDDEDEDEDEDEGEDEEAAPPAPTEQDKKYAAVQAMVEKQRAAAAAAAAVAAAAVARRKAEAENTAVPEDDDPVAAEQARKFAAAQAMVQKQREMVAKGQASAAAAIAARKGGAPTPPPVTMKVEMQRAAVAVDQAKRNAKLEELAPARPAPTPPPAEPARPVKVDAKQAAARERLSIEVKRARSEVRTRSKAVDRLRTQLDNAEIALSTAEGTLRGWETKLRAIDPSYEPPEDEPDDDDDDDDAPDE